MTLKSEKVREARLSVINLTKAIEEAEKASFSRVAVKENLLAELNKSLSKAQARLAELTGSVEP